jgi:hypothetical protein
VRKQALRNSGSHALPCLLLQVVTVEPAGLSPTHKSKARLLLVRAELSAAAVSMHAVPARALVTTAVSSQASCLPSEFDLPLQKG